MKFDVIYADCPWAYRNENCTRTFNGTAKTHYKTVSEQEIASWPVGDIAAENSLLFMWATFPKLPEALFVMKRWGYEFVTCPFVWAKFYAAGNPFMGVGFWSRNGGELVIMGRKGKGISRHKDGKGQYQFIFEEPEVLCAERTKHSRKPFEVAQRIEKLVGPDVKKIELFARKPASEDLPHVKNNGWYATGLEYDNRTLVEAIKYYEGL